MNSFNLSKCYISVWMLVAVLALINQSQAACYGKSGCLDNLQVERKNGETWKDNCDSCSCHAYNYTVGLCVEAYIPAIFHNVKKTSGSNNNQVLASLEKEEFNLFEQTQVFLKKDPARFDCPDYEYVEGAFTHFVEYIAEKKSTSCCSTSFTPGNVDSTCKVVNVDECTIKIVDKLTGKECTKPYSLTG